MILLYEPHQIKQVQLANQGDKEMQHSVDNYYNVRDVYVQKTKPKGVGKTGKFRLFYGRKQQRYYNVDSLGMKEGLIQIKK
jgi:ABC-type transporter lipoprotein component MlaA